MEKSQKNPAENAVLCAAGKQFGEREIHAARQGNLQPLLQKLNTADREKIEAALKDRRALQKMLENPQVQRLMQQLSDADG